MPFSLTVADFVCASEIERVPGAKAVALALL